MGNGVIVKVPRHKNFSTISNIFLRDKNLSLKAKGLMAFMLSLPPDWDYSVRGLVTATGTGRDAILSALKELREHGYLKMAQAKEGNGRFGTVFYTVIEEPLEEKPYSENPNSENPYSENPTQINTKLNKDLYEINTETRVADKKSCKFKKPTLEEIEEYIKEKSLNVNAQQFFDYFEAGDWHDSKGNPVRSWKQKIITWAKHDSGKKGTYPAPPPETPTAPAWTAEQRKAWALEEIQRRMSSGGVENGGKLQGPTG